MHDHFNAIRHIVDLAALAAAWAAFFDAAPKIAAMLSIVWFGIQMTILIGKWRKGDK